MGDVGVGVGVVVGLGVGVAVGFGVGVSGGGVIYTRSPKESEHSPVSLELSPVTSILYVPPSHT